MQTLYDINIGDEIQAYMKLGLSLELAIDKNGVPYRYVPSKPRRASASAISRFNGIVIANDVINKILTLSVVGINSNRIPASTSISTNVDIHYSSLKKVLLFSKYHFEPKEELRHGAQYRPTTNALGTAYRPYRTLVSIQIPK